ncbi:DUF3149 domain-containing protein [Alteromonadaceae bacterium M269]|nr:DUF3149 domain-containing protein [Alteromonadaceae bacterium M269]
MWDLVLKDPVAWGSILGIGVVVAICAFYLYLFIHNVKEEL